MSFFKKKAAREKQTSSFLNKIKGRKKIIIISVLVIVAIFAGITVPRMLKTKDVVLTTTTSKVERGDITQTIEGSGTIEAIDQYEVTSLVNGDIIADYFSEGDVLQKGDLMYQLDASDLSSNIEKAQLSIEKAQLSYNNAADELNKLNVAADISGTITNLYIKKGDQIASGGKIADVVDNSTMKLTVDFVSDFANNIFTGQTAQVELIGTFSTASGTVSKVSSGSMPNEYGVSVTAVEIEVQNPGGIISGDTATAIVGEYACSAPGTFSYSDEKTVTAKTSGTVNIINVSNGDKINIGDILCILESSSAQDAYKQNSLSLRDAQLSLDNYYDKLEDYKITAPISGKVIQKNTKAGEKLDASNASTPMAIISDLSTLVFTISVDELDISNIALGQKVNITADALEGEMFTGTIDNISIVGTSSNGVTSYPVRVLIDESENSALIPGMNVDATIVIESRENVLRIPTAAVNRGNKVTLASPNDDNKEAEVEIGLSDGTYVEIISGLSEGDEIVVPVINTSSGSLFENMMGMHDGMTGVMGGGMPAGGPPSGGGMPAGGGNMPGGGGMPGGGR